VATTVGGTFKAGQGRALVSYNLIDLSEDNRYKAITGAVVPRPIAWVTTVSADAIVNLAPFNYFTPVSTTPPVLLISFEPRDGGGGHPKDTLTNILRSGEMVVHIASADQAPLVHQTSVDYAPSESEATENALELIDCESVLVPRLAGALVAYECRLIRTIQLEAGPTLALIEPLIAHFAPGIVDEDFRVDYRRLKPLSRLMGETYLRGGELIEVPRDWDVLRYGAISKPDVGS
jgi:flavin reductase (DIM6/NTAB) family NADH-FMN oxidoreductase RutF